MGYQVELLSSYQETVRLMKRLNKQAKENGAEVPYPDPEKDACGIRLTLKDEDTVHAVKLRKPLDLASIKIEADIEQTIETMHEINAKATAAGREAPFAHPEIECLTRQIIKRPDGTMQIKDRAQPYVIQDADLDGHIHCIRALEHTKSEQMFGANAKMTEDEKHLFMTGMDLCTVELGEVQE